jgi:opacity protein-like surface antigen
MQRRATLLALAALSLSLALGSPARAGEASDPTPYARATGPYLSITGFLVGLTDSEFENASVSSVEGDLESSTGWGAALSLGARFARALRLEGELSYRQNENDRVDFGPLGDVDLDGNRQALGLMANVALEPAIGQIPLRPYIGAGLGVANVALDARDLDIDDDDWVFAYQGMVGLAIDLGRSATLFGGYRYFATDDAKLDGARVEYRAHNLEVGFRLNY